MMTVHELLVESRERLARGNYLKGKLMDGEGGYCARGAMLASMAGCTAFVSDPSQEGVRLQGEADLALAACIPQEYVQMRKSSPLALVFEETEWSSVRERTWEAWRATLRVVDYNNHPDTTKDDVLAWFDRAIAYTEPEDTTFEVATDITRELVPA